MKIKKKMGGGGGQVGGGGGGGVRVGCERRIEVFVKIQKKKFGGPGGIVHCTIYRKLKNGGGGGVRGNI